MKYSLLIHDLALNELKDAMDYYENVTPSLSEKLLKEFNEAVLYIEQKPQLFQRKFRQFRQLKLQRFPYYVVYRIEEDIIAVYRFFHAKRNPKRKYRK